MTIERTHGFETCVKAMTATIFLGALLITTAPVPAAAADPGPLDTRSAAPSTNLASLPSFANLVEKVSPAVVSIRVVEEETVGAGETPDLPFPPGSPFEKFFRDLQPRGPDGKPLRRRAMAQGSGFIISADGYIVTNNHVVESGKDITVALNNGDEMKADLVGRDPKTDLALLKVKPSKTLPYVTFDDSDKLRVGDWVLAVGNPFGLGGTVTAGIVSARGREIGAGPYDDFIQIDASINRGNSGGPTFDVKGNVVGVNTAIFSPSGGSVGIGFAIPSAIASKVVAQLKKDGKVTRGWLGVSIQPMDNDMASSLSMKEPSGALVAEVTKGSPAEKFGIQPGDVIIKVGGRTMPDVRSVSRTIADMSPGDKASIGIWRDGKERTLNITIATFPEQIAVAAANTGVEQTAAATQSLGLGLVQGDGGVVVQTVSPGSEAAEKGVRPGDVIVKISGKDVKTPADVVEGVREAKTASKTSVLLLLRNQDQQRFIALSLKKA